MVLQTEQKRNLNLTDLKKPIHLYIPQYSDNGSPADVRKNTVRYFVKPSFDINESKLIQYHKINIRHERDVVFVKLHPEIYGTPLRVYMSFSDYPTPRENDYSTVIPCKEEENKCHKDPYVFSFSPSDTSSTGIHYIGIHYYVNITNEFTFSGEGKMINMNGSIQERTRRTFGCDGGSRRKKRSCIGVKDPPPPPTPAPIILRSKYNASTDLNYTLSVSIGSCFYWSEVKEQWTDEGCEVRPTVMLCFVMLFCYVMLCCYLMLCIRILRLYLCLFEGSWFLNLNGSCLEVKTSLAQASRYFCSPKSKEVVLEKRMIPTFRRVEK